MVFSESTGVQKEMRWDLGHRELITELVKLYGPKSYLEVGVLQGKSVEAAVSYPSINRMVLCDINEEVIGHVEKVLEEQQYLGSVEFYIEKSQGVLPRLSDNFDFVHIDGDHNEDPEYEDLVNGWKLCNRVMIVHDISFRTVQRAAGRFLGTINSSELKISRFTGDQETLVIAK